MHTQIITLNQNTLGHIIDIISQSELDNSIQVIIRDAKEKRSIAANRLYWGAWLPALSEQTGYNEDELHSRFKKTYMLHIYLADTENKNQIEWCRLFDLIKEDGTPLMIQRALDTISTTWATVSQFTEYLDKIEAFCQSKDLHLPADPDYLVAMGR